MSPYRKALGLRIAPQEEITPCNWVLGDGQRQSGGNSGEDSPECGRGEQGSDLGPTRVRFVGLVGARSSRLVGAPAASGGGRRGCQSRRAAGGRRAAVELEEGAGVVVW
jgi:hypothetical protein